MDFLSTSTNLDQPTALLLRQIRAIAGVRETAKNQFKISADVSLSLIRVVAVTPPSWQAQLTMHGRCQLYPLSNPAQERQLIAVLKRAAANRDEE